MTAVFSVDVAGCSRLMGQDEAATVKNVEVFKQIIFPLIRQQRGWVVDPAGDKLLAVSGSLVDGVQCGVAFRSLAGKMALLRSADDFSQITDEAILMVLGSLSKEKRDCMNLSASKV